MKEVYAGLGNPQDYYTDWHCYNKKGFEDQTQSWRLTNPFYRLLSNSDLVFDEIHLTSESNIEDILLSHRILPAVLFYLRKKSEAKMGMIMLQLYHQSRNLLYYIWLIPKIVLTSPS